MHEDSNKINREPLFRSNATDRGRRLTCHLVHVVYFVYPCFVTTVSVHRRLTCFAVISNVASSTCANVLVDHIVAHCSILTRRRVAFVDFLNSLFKFQVTIIMSLLTLTYSAVVSGVASSTCATVLVDHIIAHCSILTRRRVTFVYFLNSLFKFHVTRIISLLTLTNSAVVSGVASSTCATVLVDHFIALCSILTRRRVAFLDF